MTMFPGQPLVKQQKQQEQQQNHVYDARSSLTSSTWFVDEGGLYNNRNRGEQIAGGGMVDQDEDDSRTNSRSTNETGSTTSNNNISLDYVYTKQPPLILPQPQQQGQPDDGWLRLGMGMSSSASNYSNQRESSHGRRSSGGGLMLELNLQPPTLSFQQPQHTGGDLMLYKPPQVHEGGGWASYLRNPRPPAVASSSSLQLQPRPLPHPDIRFINPPRRPHSGIWFMLMPSLNQPKQPSLPQLPRNYLRIKDGRMTVGLLIKYLVNKLGLDTESQVEIRCRGEELEKRLTMQDVRDRIWSKDALVPHQGPPSQQAHHHIMLLHYARI